MLVHDMKKDTMFMERAKLGPMLWLLLPKKTPTKQPCNKGKQLYASFKINHDLPQACYGTYSLQNID